MDTDFLNHFRPSSGLQNYLDAMEKLHKSVQYFTVNNPGSTQMSSVVGIHYRYDMVL